MNELNKGVANHVALIIVIFFSITFLWALAVAEEDKPTEKARQIVPDRQETEIKRLQQEENKLQIGSYNPQQVFNMYYGTQMLRSELQQIQTEKEMTQEQLQQIAGQKQQQLIQQIQGDLRKVIPPLAKEANVPVIAIQVVYSGPQVEIKDLTGDLNTKLNKLAEQTDEEEKQPVLKQSLAPNN